MNFFKIGLLCICFFHASCSGEVLQEFHLSSNIKTQIERIPERERLLLEKFFSNLIRSEGLGYVLFGSKPICLSGYFIKLPFGNMLKGSDNFAVSKGWDVWKRYEHLFSHPNYLIFEEDHVRGDKDIHPIYFINKKNLKQTLIDNLELFKKELGDDFNSENFLCSLINGQSLSEIINSHEGLLGIMLGYGTESSMQYHRREVELRTHPPFIHEEIPLQEVAPYTFFSDEILPIQFVGNPLSQSVKAILEQNAKERAHLLDIYAQGKCLEITLSKLTEQ